VAAELTAGDLANHKEMVVRLTKLAWDREHAL
jgi:hypothetical protein